MSWFPSPSTPRAAFRDLVAFMRQRSREQVIGGALAFLVTAIIVIEFLIDAKTGMRLTEEGYAIGNGILTVESDEQALVRCDPAQLDKGGAAAKAALALFDLREQYAP